MNNVKSFSEFELNERVKSLASTNNTNWVVFDGEQLPESGLKFVEEGNIFRNDSAQWVLGGTFYKGASGSDKLTDVNDKTGIFEDSNDWIITTYDGWYYKVDAEYCVWYRSKKGDIVMRCVWTTAHLKKALKSLIQKGEWLPDPDYQT